EQGDRQDERQLDAARPTGRPAGRRSGHAHGDLTSAPRSSPASASSATPAWARTGGSPRHLDRRQGQFVVRQRVGTRRGARGRPIGEVYVAEVLGRAEVVAQEGDLPIARAEARVARLLHRRRAELGAEQGLLRGGTLEDPDDGEAGEGVAVPGGLNREAGRVV